MLVLKKYKLFDPKVLGGLVFIHLLATYNKIAFNNITIEIGRASLAQLFKIKLD